MEIDVGDSLLSRKDWSRGFPLVREFEIDRVFLLLGGGTSANISDHQSCPHSQNSKTFAQPFSFSNFSPMLIIGENDWYNLKEIHEYQTTIVGPIHEIPQLSKPFPASGSNFGTYSISTDMAHHTFMLWLLILAQIIFEIREIIEEIIFIYIKIVKKLK